MDSKNDNSQPKDEQLQKSLLKWEESLFKSSPRDLYTYRKAEKICSAVHFITNFLNDKEPLRLALREKSIDLLSLSLSFIRNADLPALLSSMSIRLVEIKSFLQTAYFSGLVSEMNFNIVKDELDHLLSIIETKRQTLFALPVSFLEVSLPEPTEESIGQSIGQTPRAVVSNVSFPAQNLPKKKEIIVSKPVFSERANKILNLLKTGRELTIRDFSDSIKGCSEKTLQRELLKMVAEGKITKKGERRWSRYSL